MKYIYILKTYLTLGFKVYWLNRKYTKRLFKVLTKILAEENHSLSKDLKARISFYTAQCYLSASWTCALRGKKLTKQEKKNVIYLGAITPILDDLTDALRITSSKILLILKAKNESKQPEIIVAKYLYEKLQNMKNEYFNAVFEEALISQDPSLLQLEEKSLSENELRKIAHDKGAMFVLLYRAVLSTPLRQGEEEVLITLGYALQQTNDMFDIYKDYVNKQQTLFTNSKNIHENHLDYQSTLRKIIAQFYLLDFNTSNIEKCLIEVSTITSRGMVCLNQLLLLQGNRPDFKIAEFTRKQLVCDMEKANNIMSSLSFSFMFYDQIKTYNRK